MNFDLRLPIGLMFSVFGAMLTIYGITHSNDTTRLGINIDLYWGLVMLVFGVFMLFLALKGGKKPGPPPS